MKIGIIGLGLIGGSIFKDLQKLGMDVIGISESQCGKKIFKDYEVLKDCDIVFVCSAMNKTLEILDKLETVLTPETTVTDVCSLKSFVCQKKRPYRFVPSHPMAGTEHRGFEHSFEGLFKGAKWAITPIFGESEELVEIIEKLGATPVITTPQQHDEAVALISHMPMVISQAIFKTAQENPLALEIAASGFRDMTRLAMSNTEMANDMVQMNSENIQTSILKLYQTIGNLTGSDYLNQIEKIRKERRQMF
ncbi:MAG: prephenate dehydrogenase/arogenate dehydrogenase family protein [Muribaculaceae bacterium]|nr:prephenate dehydrogenase/arogenate dehydrogenase family protein [Muribaculaceae bacterium]